MSEKGISRTFRGLEFEASVLHNGYDIKIIETDSRVGPGFVETGRFSFTCSPTGD